VAELNPWKEAIIDAAVVDWVYTADMEDDPRKAVNALLSMAALIALDPAVSKDAQALVDRGRAECAAELARWRRAAERAGIYDLDIYEMTSGLVFREPPHPWTPGADKNRCTICGEGPWGRHRFQEPPPGTDPAST
jgi:hypothetical protein